MKFIDAKTHAVIWIANVLAASRLVAGTMFHDPIYGVSITSNVVYGTGVVGTGTLNLELDLYQPADIGGGALPALSPGIVLIHGGLDNGDKADLAAAAQTFASYGYTVASINHRVIGDNVPPNTGPADSLVMPPPPFLNVPDPEGIYTFNAAVEDASKAMAWMRANSALYDVDSSRIALGGASAGAIISQLQAYNSPPAEVAPQVVLSYLGAMYGTESSILAGAPPAFIVASSDDPVVPFDAPLGTQAMVDRMNAVGVYNDFYVQTGIGHGVNFALMFDGQTLLEHNIDFLATVLVPEPSTMTLIVLGLAAFAIHGWRRRRLM